jgi:hypothetical protein
VAIIEAFCFLAAILITLWLKWPGVPPYLAFAFSFALYGVPAMFPNLLLFPSEYQSGGYLIS